MKGLLPRHHHASIRRWLDQHGGPSHRASTGAMRTEAGHIYTPQHGIPELAGGGEVCYQGHLVDATYMN